MTHTCDCHRGMTLRRTACVSAVVAIATGSLAQAQDRGLSVTKQTNGAAIRRAFMDVVQQANHWTVRVRIDSETQTVAYGNDCPGRWLHHLQSKPAQWGSHLPLDGRERATGQVCWLQR